MMTSRTLATLLIGFALSACGGTPTAPTPPAAPTPDARPVVTQPPAVDPPPPAPAPVPTPAPTPAPPAPAPVPGPQPSMVLDATTDGAHWDDPAHALPGTFVITVWADAVSLGDTRIPRLAQPEHLGIVAQDATHTLTMQRDQLAGQWRWMFNGAAGQAAGMASQR